MLLQLENLQAYYGKSHVLRDINLSVERGEVVVLMGRNGAGRSTTLKTIMGIVPPKNGTVTFDNVNINRLSPFQIANMGIAYVPEERRIFNGLSVLENLKIAMIKGNKGEWNEKKVFQFLPRLEERKNQLGRGLSGGEKQMLAIARALVANPKIILLDEPLEGLAPLIRKDIEEIVLEVKKEGMTMLLVEQNVAFALRVADRGFILNDGKIVTEGTTEEFRQNPNLIKQYLAV